MLDSNDLVNLIKRIVSETVKAGNPSDFLFGVVVKEKPLNIKIEQKITLTQKQLVLCRNVTDFKVKTPQEITVYNGLKVGEKVALIKEQGGQRYLVIDRVVGT